MADETSSAYRVQTLPNEDGIRQPVTYANTSLIVGDQVGLTVYFFSAPADSNNLPESVQALKAKTPDGIPTVTVKLAPVAKLFIPHEHGRTLLQALAENVALWEKVRQAGGLNPAGVVEKAG